MVFHLVYEFNLIKDEIVFSPFSPIGNINY